MIVAKEQHTPASNNVALDTYLLSPLLHDNSKVICRSCLIKLERVQSEGFIASRLKP